MTYASAIGNSMIDSRARYGEYLMEKTKRSLKAGRIYTLPVETFDERGCVTRAEADYRLLRIFPHHALFVRKTRSGAIEHRCFRFMELSGYILSEKSRSSLRGRLNVWEE